MTLRKYFIFSLLLLAVSFLLPVSASAQSLANNDSQGIPDEVRAQMFMQGESVVDSYLLAQGNPLDKDSPEYQAFLYQVLNDNVPELYANGNASAVTYYAIQQLGLQPDTETPEVDLTLVSKSQSIFLPLIQSANSSNLLQNAETNVQASEVNGYNRTAAVNYANTWVYQGDGKKRNPNYPDFVENDCTNFTSQVAFAGGVALVGTGSCGIESTTSKWYVKKLAQSCNSSNWASSTSWVRVSDFRIHMRDNRGAYVEAYPANNESLSLLISRIQPGDFVQLDTRSCWGSWCSDWSPTHATIVVEMKNNGGYYRNDALYNDHSGRPNGNDYYKRGLRDKYQQWINEGVTNERRMVWIKLQ